MGDNFSKRVDSYEEEAIEKELAENEELRHLPRKRRPETIGSIFDQPFPIPETNEVIDLLRSPSLRSEARIKRNAILKVEEERCSKW